MTDTSVVEEQTPYSHPKLREMTHEKLLQNLEEIRARRLVAALEFKTAEANRLEREHDKLTDKWNALAAKLSKKEYAIREEIAKFEQEVNKLIAISNQMKIMEVDH